MIISLIMFFLVDRYVTSTVTYDQEITFGHSFVTLELQQITLLAFVIDLSHGGKTGLTVNFLMTLLS